MHATYTHTDLHTRTYNVHTHAYTHTYTHACTHTHTCMSSQLYRISFLDVILGAIAPYTHKHIHTYTYKSLSSFDGCYFLMFFSGRSAVWPSY